MGEAKRVTPRPAMKQRSTHCSSGSARSEALTQSRTVPLGAIAGLYR